jgi:hypothetical protein
LFEIGQVGPGVAPELGPQRPYMAALFKAVAECAPVLSADTAKVACGGRVLSRCDGGDQANLAAQHDGGRGRLPSRGTPLVVALGSEQLFEVVVGPGQAGHGIAVEQSGTVAAGDLGEVLDGGCQRAGLVTVPEHGAEQPVEPAPDRTAVLALVVVQQPCCSMHPGIGACHRRPEWGRAVQAATDQLAEPRERRG